MAYHQELEPEVGAFCLNSESNQMELLPSLNGVEEVLGYKFKNWRLLEEAFTDSSFPDKRVSFERLEHVGDFVLNLLFTKKHYFKYLDLPLDALTRLQATNVDTEKLACVAIKHELHRFLRHKKPFLRNNREMLKIHPVTELYEVCPKKHLKVKFVDLQRESIVFDVFIDDQLVGRGTYGLKKEIAHNRATKDALDNIGRIPGEKDSADESCS
ncbi:hypothetical protein GH714_018165 [Hevea brasiliensis]|uniref:RNase III domain-containing protein n=1 Tax=Hevea brasiliensis TaxID=3981 RepID=A0A6A6KUK8_HEVBR|nr:hypothetical protein GH714_018165 [Hevea brasiliensis]